MLMRFPSFRGRSTGTDPLVAFRWVLRRLVLAIAVVAVLAAGAAVAATQVVGVATSAGAMGMR
jgi:hypothetical protein